MFVLGRILALFYTGSNNIVDNWSEIIAKTLEYPRRNPVYSGRFIYTTLNLSNTGAGCIKT